MCPKLLMATLLTGGQLHGKIIGRRKGEEDCERRGAIRYQSSNRRFPLDMKKWTGFRQEVGEAKQAPSRP